MIAMSRARILQIVLAAGVACATATAHADPYLQSGDTPFVEFFLNQSRDGDRELRRSETKPYDVEVWDPRAKKLISSITGLSGVVNVANISPDGRKVVTAERSGIVGVWDAATGKQLKLLEGHEDQPHDARFSPDGKMIVSGGRDGTARTWNLETGAQIAVHKQHGGNYVDTVSFSPDGKWILSAGNGWLDVWNATSGKEFSATKVGPEDEGGFSIEARFTPDGKSIILMDDEGKLGKTYPIELPAE